MIGEMLGSYRIESVLGSGAMGVVYRGVNDTTGRTVALKVIANEAGQKSNAYERFRREAEILQQLRHPNIVRFLQAVGRSKGTSYVVMEYIAGSTLDQLLATRGPLPWREVVSLGIQVCDALHYAHEHGVVHRDLKPSNLMVTEEGQVKLTDFGIAKDLDATALTATGRTLGTAAYMAPEQIRGTPGVTHKTDLYALGIVLYQMLTGAPAFTGPSAVILMHLHLNEDPPRPSAKVAEIPAALDELIVKLMAKAPADRPWDAAAVSLALTELRDKADQGKPIPMVWPSENATPTRAGLTVPKKPRKTAKSPGQGFPIDRATLEVGGLVLALVLLGGFLGFMLWPPGATYLYRQAERLMASNNRNEWIAARDDYIDPLDSRFPKHPYHETTRAWRDRIELSYAEDRAKFLDSPVLSKLSEPSGKGEHLYAAFSAAAREAAKRGDEIAGLAQWEEMASQLQGATDPLEYRWRLLARKRADDLNKGLRERRQIVTVLIEKIAAALRAGKFQEAQTIRDEVVTRYQKYTDLADLLPRAGLSPAPAPSPEPTPTPAAPPKEPETPKGP